MIEVETRTATEADFEKFESMAWKQLDEHYYSYAAVHEEEGEIEIWIRDIYGSESIGEIIYTSYDFMKPAGESVLEEDGGEHTFWKFSYIGDTNFEGIHEDIVLQLIFGDGEIEKYQRVRRVPVHFIDAFPTTPAIGGSSTPVFSIGYNQTIPPVGQPVTQPWIKIGTISNDDPPLTFNTVNSIDWGRLA